MQQLPNTLGYVPAIHVHVSKDMSGGSGHSFTIWAYVAIWLDDAYLAPPEAVIMLPAGARYAS